MSRRTNADEQPPRPARQSQRPRRAPAPRDKTPSPQPAAPPRAPRRRRQPAPQPVPPVDPDEERARAPAAGRVRDVFDADEPEPDAPVGDAAAPPADSAGEDHDDGEFFPEPAPSTSPSPSPDRASPPHGRRRHSPRAGPHASPSPPRRDRTTARARSTKANDIWTFYQTAADGVKRDCVFCKQHHSANPQGKEPKSFAPSTSTGVLRRHLFERHLEAWVQGCDRLRIPITATEALPHVEAYRGKQNGSSNNGSATDSAKKSPPFSHEAFVDAIVEWIVSDDQSINVIENEKLRNIFLMLRSELKDSDIPHRTKIRKRVMEIWDDHLDHLQDEMAASIGKISTTMDLWSDKQKQPFMAVTAHWLESKIVDTAAGPQYELTLRTDLIGFLRVPGHHTGEHLATAFLHIIDRIKIASKLGWITLDNASNNDTFVEHLESELRKRRIPFNHLHRRIRCFPHIVNLACKAVLSAITNMDFAAAGADDFVPGGAEPRTFLDAIARDPIATVRTSVRVIRASSLRRQYFSEVLRALHLRDLQLLRDVDTRWSSTLIMIDRAVLLQEAIDKFLTETQDLKKYKLSKTEWEALKAFQRILSVPHAFQQRLSAETTPTLGHALPAFEAMISQWEKQQTRHPETADIVQQGIDKLDDYRERVEDVPAYILSMLINPAIKLNWFERYRPEKTQSVKNLFLRELEAYRGDLNNFPARPSATNWADEILGMASPTRPVHRQSLEDEVRAYFTEAPYSLGSVRYWESNQLRYPTIFSLALDILPIQGSAVPCERVFSSSAETDTLRRSRIAPDLMEALQMLKFSFKKGRGLNFTAGTSRDDEIALMEIDTDDRGLIPEDATGFSSFIQSLLDAEYESE